MRILSQDGTFDVPYEAVVIQRHEKGIYFLNIGLSGVANADIKLAECSTAEKAKTAMKMLQNAYYENEREKVYKDTVSYLTTHFQFPVDGEIK